MTPPKWLIREELAAKALSENATGIEVKMHSDECVKHKATHDNCYGCPSHIACAKTVGILLATMSRNPKEKIVEVLRSKSLQEIDYDFLEEGETE